MRLSLHFSEREFACPHCGVVRVRPDLIVALERLRAAVDRPLVILSGYRCPIHNEAMGGATRSQHLLGRAADLHPYVATVTQAESAGFVGIGNRGRWAVHVDTRIGPAARWRY